MTNLIQTFLASLNDLETAQSLVTADARFIAVREESYPELPLYGTFVGHDGLSTFVDGLRAHFDTRSFVLDRSIENAAFGAAFGRFEHRIRTTGRLFRSHWAIYCAFDAGKISEYRFYEDTAALEEAMEVQTRCKETVT